MLGWRCCGGVEAIVVELRSSGGVARHVDILIKPSRGELSVAMCWAACIYVSMQSNQYKLS